MPDYMDEQTNLSILHPVRKHVDMRGDAGACAPHNQRLEYASTLPRTSPESWTCLKLLTCRQAPGMIQSSARGCGEAMQWEVVCTFARSV